MYVSLLVSHSVGLLIFIPPKSLPFIVSWKKVGRRWSYSSSPYHFRIQLDRCNDNNGDPWNFSYILNFIRHASKQLLNTHHSQKKRASKVVVDNLAKPDLHLRISCLPLAYLAPPSITKLRKASRRHCIHLSRHECAFQGPPKTLDCTPWTSITGPRGISESWTIIPTFACFWAILGPKTFSFQPS